MVAVGSQAMVRADGDALRWPRLCTVGHNQGLDDCDCLEIPDSNVDRERTALQRLFPSEQFLRVFLDEYLKMLDTELAAANKNIVYSEGKTPLKGPNG